MLRERSRIRGLELSLLLLCLSGAARAQVASGTLTGLVKDPTGAVVAKAAITITNEAMGDSVRVLSNTSGVYELPQVPPGTYSVDAEVPGFKRLVVRHLTMDVGSTLTQDLVLQVGEVSESVQVSGQANLVETTSSQVGTTVAVNHVLEMPLNDRNVFNLVNLVPGAYGLSYGDSAGNAYFLNVSLGGSRMLQTMALVDGVNVTQGGGGFNNIDMSPPVDAMQEFKVQVNSLSAEYGHTMGGVINAVTKSGTNQFHGSFYEFLRNDKLDAAGWGNDHNPPLHRNIFGGTIGGPIRKNRTFFFYNYDALRNHQGSAVTRNIGLPVWRTGDLSTAMRQLGNQAQVVQIYDPTTGSGTFTAPRDTKPFPGNLIPSSRLDPVAVKALSYLPAPNRPADNGFNQAGNWQLNRVEAYTRDYHTMRVDHDVTDNTKVFFRYIFTTPDTDTVPSLSGYGPADPNITTSDNHRQNAAFNLNHLFSPTFFMDYTIGVYRVFSHLTGGPCCSTNYAQVLGLGNVPGPSFPQFNFGGGGLVPMTNIGAGGPDRRASETNWNHMVSFTKIRGAHTLKFGAEVDTYNGNLNVQQTPSGNYGFDGHFTEGYTAAGKPVAGTGLPLADFLLGRLNTVDVSIEPTNGVRSQAYAGYVQDDWHATRNLTLNLGLRYDTQTPFYGVNDRLSNFNPYAVNPLAGTGDIPAGALGEFTFQNRNGDGKYLYQWNVRNFGPRFGFAYRLFGSSNTVIRGGYGIFYGLETPGGVINQVPAGFVQGYHLTNPIPFTLQQGVPNGVLAPPPESVLTHSFGVRNTTFAQGSVNFLDPSQPAPYTQNFTVNVQHTWAGMLIEAGYLGNLARHAPLPATNLNQIPPQLLSQTAIPQRFRRPFTILNGDLAPVNMTYSDWGLSDYNAFVLKLERRYRDGFSWIVSYSYTKWLDNVPSTSTTGSTWTDNNKPQNIYNRAAEKSLSTSDIPHRLVASPIVELPFGKNRRWLNRTGFADALLGGWEISTIATLQSGSPFGISVLNGARDILGDATAQATLRPNIVGDPNAAPQGGPAVGVRGIQWMNPAAFATPAPFTYGNVSRTIPGILSPGLINFDTVMSKNFKFRERWRLQTRWETFNMTNTPYWGVPNEVMGGTNFGVITSAGGRRIMQLGMKLYW